MSAFHAEGRSAPHDVTPPGRSLRDGLRPEALGPPDSGIVEIFNYGRNRQGLIPLWVGEGDLPTPGFIADAAARSFAAGETFYTYQRGIPELRAAIAAYMTRCYGTPFADDPTPFAPERFHVTVGGMHALQIAIRMMAGSGDEVLVPTPGWPNFRGAVMAAGGAVVEVPVQFSGRGADGRWSLDIDRLAGAVTGRTRAIVVNSPSNPTGWIASRADLEALLDLSRRHGLWIVADEIYGRLVYEAERAPSFHDVMAPDDRVLFVQTLSKNWAMTGWRVGWLEAPPELGGTIENLVQYSTSGVPVPLQRGAAMALEEGEETVQAMIARSRRSRDILCEALAGSGRLHFARPGGAFYLFARADGFADSRGLAFSMVDEIGVGVAPGSAFGEAGEGFMRLCFARDPASVAEVGRRLAAWLHR
ncbi:MAG TPA: pyridoxal phosphate-dependent aminotransferase [Lichenihabitans sp.]|jgi:aspartate/methionine/tyrosine aminotransferase|nr:pyridoxal phosphate-dependent aminotransferase [Lichenihabitans sp.]